MKFLNNPEIKRFLVITGIIGLLFCAVICFFSPTGALISLGMLISLGICFIIFERKRYKRINLLTQTIDKILHGNDTINIKSYGEGELSILEIDVQKMLTRLREQKDILEKERSFLSDSIADISHQLRTPLTSINLVLSLMLSPDITPERQRELLRELSSLISKTEYLVSMLLKISKLDAGTVQFEMKEASFMSLIKKAAEPLMVPMDIKNQSLVLDFDNINLNCDFHWSLEAFGNILKNCTEHTPDGGTITVRAKDTPIFTEIIISDTGCGFSEEDLPHIFERFYKGSNSSKESFGIGLNLAKMIINAQNGVIKAENSNEGSAKFTVRFYKQVI